MTDAPTSPPTGRADRLILAYVGGLLVLWAPGLNLGLLTPRVALLAVGLGPGLIVLGSLVRRRDVGAGWLVALLAWGLVSVAFAAQPRLAFLGTYGSDVGWIYLAGYASAWALGRRLSPVGARLLPAVLLVGLGTNVFFALMEAAFEPTGALASVDGRVIGLMSNSLFLAGLLAGGLALIGYLSASNARRGTALAALAVPFTAAINLTGSRAALVGGVALGLVAAVVARRARGGNAGDLARSAAVVGAAVAVGFCLSIPLQGTASGTSRIGDVSSSSGYESRLIMWDAGLKATGERPIVGWGPGRFREATSSRTTAAFARAEPPDRLFYDAHNLFVEHLVTTGIVGLVLLGGFLVLVARRVRGPLAWFAAGVALTWLLNPLSVCTAPVVLVAIGAAWTRAPKQAVVSSPRPVATVRGAGAGLACVGLLVGGSLIWADVLIERATVDGDVALVRDAARLRPRDPVLQALETDALVHLALADPTPANKQAVVDSANEAVRLDPTRPTWWVRRGSALGAYGPGSQAERLDAARADYQEALRLNPWSLEALASMRDLAAFEDDAATVRDLTDRICQISSCPPP